MAEIRTVTTLTSKRDEIARSIVGYERKLAQARADLAHIIATLTIFSGAGDPGDHRPYVDLMRVFRYGEIGALSLAALANGPLSTPDIAKYVMAAKGLDTGDKVLAKTVCLSVVHSMRGMANRRKVNRVAKRAGVCVWSIP
jgi:hypothetical protein